MLSQVGQKNGFTWALVPELVVPLTWLELCDLGCDMRVSMCLMTGGQRRPILMGKLRAESLPEFARESVKQIFARSDRRFRLHWRD
mmetsp:Transcript_59886/g.147214  ORF Transcript_59886/g.147214 Transcript_59886/m.147214 type:complete len:86 (-) Transcript_59886:67-324(-)